MSDEPTDYNSPLIQLVKQWGDRAHESRQEAKRSKTPINDMLFMRSDVLEKCAEELLGYCKKSRSGEQPATHYHQKPIADMTPGELRAYRRKLARAALTGYCSHKTYGLKSLREISDIAIGQAESMIERERREEGGAE